MSDSQSQRPRGLSAVELAAALDELRREILPAEVLDVACLRGKDDLLLFLRPRGAVPQKVALHLVPGAGRGRVTRTRRRFAKADLATGPSVDWLRQRLTGATLVGAEALAGERIARLTWQQASETSGSLVVELFGNRGLWFVLDADGRILTQSRLPNTKDRELRPQAVWQPPPPRAHGDESPSRFVPPVLAAIDASFTASDHAAEVEDLASLCARALARAGKSSEHKVQGLTTQLEGADRAPRLRADADLMLAYAHTVRRGQTSMRVPDPERDGAEIELLLAADKPVVAQAQALYERARRLTDAIVVTRQRLAAAEQERAGIERWVARLRTATDFDALQTLRDDLQRAGLLPRQAAPSTPTKAKGGSTKTKTSPGRGGAALEAYRRFVSVEGYEILCGKTNAQNDRLTKRTARGNDVWLHIGRGYAGSHVVVRLPKGKTASLETMLDAAAIAVHFSKARGAGKAEVIYTQAKHVRKPKGSAAGQVVPSQTKTLFVRLDEERLQRLLSSSSEEA